MGCGIADTTAYIFEGFVADQEGLPLKYATVILGNGKAQLKLSTNRNGHFSLHSFIDYPNSDFTITKIGYQCLIVKRDLIFNYINFRIKLKKR
jgi:hypothetical protein